MMQITFVHARCHGIDWSAAGTKSNPVLITGRSPTVGVANALNGEIPIRLTGIPIRVAEGSTVKVVVGCIRHVAVRIHHHTFPVGPRRICRYQVLMHFITKRIVKKWLTVARSH